MPRIDETARIISNKKVGQDTYLMELYAQKVASSSLPGQFVMIEARDEVSKDPLLRRPFSICGISSPKENIQILYRVVGKGTSILTTFGKGRRIKVLGPLGTTFDLKGSYKRFLVAGGIGVAPLLFLAQHLMEKGQDFTFIWGMQSKKDFFEMDHLLFSKKSATLPVIVTEDGSLGEKGLVTAPLKKILEEHGKHDQGQYNDRTSQTLLQACGPPPMLKAVSGMAKKYAVRCEVSLEAAMACGLGLCLGCAIKKATGGEGYFHVCKDGPVMDAEKVF